MSIRYHYEAVPPGHIRVLQLLPGADDEPLAGELNLLRLPEADSSEQALPFEALSYVWGSDVKPHTLNVSGCTVPITTSLYSALIRFRFTDRRRALWADGVCINQNDVADKELQVPLMAKIYTGATRVLADLGETSDTSDAALDLIDRHWRTVICSGAYEAFYGPRTPIETAAIMTLPPEAVDMTWAHHELPKHTSHDWDNICSLLQRPWFSRIWIVQEFVLARRVTFYCGTRAVDWRHLLALFFDFNAPSSFDKLVMMWRANGSRGSYVMRHEMITRMFHNRGIRLLSAQPAGRVFLASLPQFSDVWTRNSLADLLHAYRGFNCTIARDRYYALLGMASDHHIASRLELKPDYTMSDEEWHLRIGKFLLQLPGGAEVFMRSGLPEQTDPTWPSWLQTFNYPADAAGFAQSDFDQASAAAGANSVFPVLEQRDGNPEVIILRGHKLGTITKLSKPSLSHPETSAHSLGDVTRIRLASYLSAALDLFTEAGDSWKPDWQLLEAMVMAFAINSKPSVAMSIAVGFAVDIKVLVLGYYMLFTKQIGLADRVSNWTGLVHNALHCEDATTKGDQDEAAEAAREALQKRGLNSAAAYTSVTMTLHMIPALTDQGRFSVVPRATKVEDEAWVIQGVRLPVVLRRGLSYPERCQLVGTCYIDGAMLGEALAQEGFQWGEVCLH